MSKGTRVNWMIVAIGAAIVLPLVAVLASGFNKDPHALPSMLEGRVAPPFALHTLEGAPVDLPSLAGTPVILNFWSTWCQPCRFEHPYLQESARAFPDVRFFGILYGDEAEKARRYLRQQGSAYPTLDDPGGRVAIEYGVAGVPETFFIDRHGKILHKFSGPLPPDVIRAYVAELRAP